MIDESVLASESVVFIANISVIRILVILHIGASHWLLMYYVMITHNAVISLALL